MSQKIGKKINLKRRKWFKAIRTYTPYISVLCLLIPVWFVGNAVVHADSGNEFKDVQNMQINVGGDEKVTGKVIDDWLASDGYRKSSPLAGHGDEVVKVADKYGINRAFFVALIDAETSMGVNACFGDEYNFGCSRSFPEDKNSVEGGLTYVAELVSKYIDGSISGELKENPTIQEFTNVYAPAFENDHKQRFSNHGAVFGILGVTAKEMQASGKLKDGSSASTSEVDYTAESTRSIASNCPINCDLADTQKATADGSGANTGNVKFLPKGELWKNPSNLKETELNYMTDQATEDNIVKFLEEITSFSDDEAKKYGNYFYEASKTSGIDARFLVAFWSVNTNNGKSEAWKNTYNAFGWETGEDFKDEREGIIEGAKLVSINYINDGQNTINKLVSDTSGHIVSADDKWASAVSAIMKKSEKFIGESTGNTPNDFGVRDDKEWTSEQCIGEGLTGSETAITGSGYVEQVINYLRDEGLTDQAIAGILGNMQKESGINPKRIQATTVEQSEAMTDAERDSAIANASSTGSYAAGIVQWESARFGLVRAKAASLGVSPYSMEPQMAILVQELQQISAGAYGSGSLYDLYKSTTDVYTATSAFAGEFERCAACRAGTGEFEERTQYANDYFSTYFK